MADFDSILNAVIPWVVAIVGMYILYRPLKEPLRPMFRGIGNFFRGIKRMITGENGDDSLFEEVATLEYE